MKLDFLPLDKLAVSRTNMRFGKRPPDVSDILPSVRRRGVLQPVLVRPAPDAGDGRYDIVAGARRFTAATIIAGERRVEGAESDPLDMLLPCAILETSDDADAVEASLIENIARLDPDEVTQWVTFTRLIKEGRAPDDIAATFGLPEIAVKRVLALGNLLPRIRSLYAQSEIDRATIRPLTLASKRQQQEWLRLYDDPETRAPTGASLKAWLLGGQSIPTNLALFDVERSGLAAVADLFREDRCFADAAAFWAAQNQAVAARREAYLAQGWSEVVILGPDEHFYGWDHEKLAKRKGGRVYIDVRATGEVAFHEGYVGRREAERAARAALPKPGSKPPRAEITSAMQTYVDLHRHAAVRAALTAHPGVALRLMVAHAIVGSPLWTVRREAQATRDDATRESVETCHGETRFDERRRAVLDLLGMDPERTTVFSGNADSYELVRLFLRLLDLPDAALGDVVAVAMGETLYAGGAAVEAVGLTIGMDMAQWWHADAAFFHLVRDKEVLGAMVAEVAGDGIAAANAGEGKTLKRIVSDHIEGADGRPKVALWVPRWMAFPPAAYTARGGVGTVSANAIVTDARRHPVPDDTPDPTAPGAVAPLPAPEEGKAVAANDAGDETDTLAA